MTCTTLPVFTPSRKGSCSFHTFAEIWPLAFPSWSTANGSPFLVTLSSRPRTMSSCCTRAPTASVERSIALMRGSWLRHPHDLAFFVDSHFRLQSADAAAFPCDPRFVQLGAIPFRDRFHAEFLVVVLAAVF